MQDFGGKMTISSARTMFIVNIEFFKNQNTNLKDNSSSSKKSSSREKRNETRKERRRTTAEEEEIETVAKKRESDIYLTHTVN